MPPLVSHNNLSSTNLANFAAERPAQVLSKSLGATFDDTESQRPNGTLVRKLVNRDNKKNNPLNNFIQRTKNAQKELKLGNKSLSEIIAERAASAKLVAITEKMALATPQSVKRGRADAREPEESTKRIKREFKIKFDGEDSPEVNNDTVKPENVLRMVDQSLVETPEKNTTETPQAQARRYQDYYSSSYQPRGMQPGDGSPAVGSKYQRFAGDRRSMPADYSDPYRSGPSDASGFNQYEADYSTNRFNVPQFGDNRHNNIGRDYFTRSGRNGHTARVPPLSKATNYGDFNRGPQYDEFGRVPQSNNSFGPGHRRGHSVQNSDTSRYYSRGASQEYEDKWDRQDW